MLASSIGVPNHFDAVFNQLTTIFIDCHRWGLSLDLAKNAILVFTLTIFKHWAQNKNAEFVVTHFLEMSDNCIRYFHSQIGVAFLEHSLDNSAAVFIEAVIYYKLFNLANEINKWLRLNVLAHLSYDLLNNMVSIKIEGAIFDPSLVQEFLYHLVFLKGIKNIDSCLNHSASMLVGWILEHVTPDVVEYNV